MKKWIGLALLLLLAMQASAQMRVAALPSKSSVVTFRVVFTAGAASDPKEKPGVANLTALMLSDGGTKDLTYKQIVDALFPMAASVASQVDKEMTTFYGATHVDNLDAYYKLFRLITKGVPAGSAVPMLNATVHGSCHPMDLPLIQRQTDAEGVDYFEVPITFTEIGDE